MREDVVGQIVVEAGRTEGQTVLQDEYQWRLRRHKILRLFLMPLLQHTHHILQRHILCGE